MSKYFNQKTKIIRMDFLNVRTEHMLARTKTPEI